MAIAFSPEFNIRFTVPDLPVADIADSFFTAVGTDRAHACALLLQFFETTKADLCSSLKTEIAKRVLDRSILNRMNAQIRRYLDDDSGGESSNLAVLRDYREYQRNLIDIETDQQTNRILKGWELADKEELGNALVEQRQEVLASYTELKQSFRSILLGFRKARPDFEAYTRIKVDDFLEAIFAASQLIPVISQNNGRVTLLPSPETQSVVEHLNNFNNFIVALDGSHARLSLADQAATSEMHDLIVLVRQRMGALITETQATTTARDERLNRILEDIQGHVQEIYELVTVDVTRTISDKSGVDLLPLRDLIHNAVTTPITGDFYALVNKAIDELNRIKDMAYSYEGAKRVPKNPRLIKFLQKYNWLEHASSIQEEFTKYMLNFEKLVSTCEKPFIVRRYLDVLMQGGRDALSFGYDSCLAYARYRQINLYFWRYRYPNVPVATSVVLQDYYQVFQHPVNLAIANATYHFYLPDENIYAKIRGFTTNGFVTAQNRKYVIRRQDKTKEAQQSQSAHIFDIIDQAVIFKDLLWPSATSVESILVYLIAAAAFALSIIQIKAAGSEKNTLFWSSLGLALFAAAIKTAQAHIARINNLDIQNKITKTGKKIISSFEYPSDAFIKSVDRRFDETYHSYARTLTIQSPLVYLMGIFAWVFFLVAAILKGTKNDYAAEIMSLILAFAVGLGSGISDDYLKSQAANQRTYIELLRQNPQFNTKWGLDPAIDGIGDRTLTSTIKEAFVWCGQRLVRRNRPNSSESEGLDDVQVSAD